MSDEAIIRLREEETPGGEQAGGESLQVCEQSGAVTAEPVGRKWRVRIFEYGLSKNLYPAPNGGERLPLKWTAKAAESAVALLEGARCFADHGKGGVRDLIGFFSNPAVGAKGPEADLTILESEDWAMKKMRAAHQIGRALGFSVDAAIQMRVVREGQSSALEVERLLALNSVDMVSRASSGGAPLKVLEETTVLQDEQNPGGEASASTAGNPGSAVRSNNEKGATMKNQIKRILESLRAIPGLGATFVAEAANIEAELGKDGADESALLIRATEASTKAAAEALQASGKVSGEVKTVQEDVKALQAQVAEAQKRQQASDAALLIREKLDAAKLPAPARKLAEQHLAGTVATAEQIDAEIKSVREAFAAMSPDPSRISTRPYQAAEITITEFEKLETALDRFMGVTHKWTEVREGGMIRMVQGEEVDRSIPAFAGIREAYTAFTGDHEVRGEADARHIRLIREEWNNAGFPAAFGNTIGRLLLQDYKPAAHGILNLVKRSSVPDFKTQERVRFGYYGDIPDVNPENADYAEIAAPTDEKATFLVGQKGGIVTVTRKAIINDDLGITGQQISRLGRAAARTLAQHVTDFFVNNAAIYDAVAWFHAGHGNLGSTALSTTELEAIRAAFRAFAEKDSNKRLELMPRWLMVPYQMESLALKTNQSEYNTNSLADKSTVQHMFGTANERIIVNTLLADANDYYVMGDPEDAPFMEVGFLQGRQEPEFFLADGETTSERMFLGDRIRYKVRHEYKGVVIDFRNVYKEAVA